MKFEDKRQGITIEDFREKFCNDCFWKINNDCDIRIVKTEKCVHAGFYPWEYKLIVNAQKYVNEPGVFIYGEKL